MLIIIKDHCYRTSDTRAKFDYKIKKKKNGKVICGVIIYLTR